MPDSLPPIEHAAVALLPVLAFLTLLLLLDSYKLVKPLGVVKLIGAGVAAAFASWGASRLALGRLELDLAQYSAHVAPLLEELLKGLVIVWLARAHRIGFLVDAAIFGFAVGSGFALVENLAYLRMAHAAELSTWIVRGFGTALMHGGATAMLAVMATAVLERKPEARFAAFIPGLALGTALHWAFNQLTHWPLLATLATLFAVPALLLVVFHHSERGLAHWLAEDFDADAGLLEAMRSGRFATSHAGHYLQSLKQVLSGEMMVDALCYLRLYAELSLRAKGILMAREHELPVPPLDAATRAKLDELRHLERALGVSGRRAFAPLLNMRRKDLWQLNLLDDH
jgi:protease PrsW